MLTNAIPFPPGANDSDTLINGFHLDLPTLLRWDYSLFENGTLSNGSQCILTFDRYHPTYVFPNGTFLNDTSCYEPILPAGPLGHASIGVAVAFTICLVLTMVNLGRHGKEYLHPSRRFVPVGRRWQWYWTIIACVLAIIGLFTKIDVARNYMLQIAIVLTSFFWYLLTIATMCIVWEAVRHWGSWSERQVVDADPYAFPNESSRERVEFFLPLIYYLFACVSFFLLIPRPWGSLELQRSEEQIIARAEPMATDIRFKLAPFILLLSWIVIIVSLCHSLYHYAPGLTGRPRSLSVCISQIQWRFALIIPLAFAMLAYQCLASFYFKWSPLCAKGNMVAIFVGGYLPQLFIIAVQLAHGFTRPNEDKELIRQRRERGAIMDRELGIINRPTWWRRIRGLGNDAMTKDSNSSSGTAYSAAQNSDKAALRQKPYSDAPLMDGGIELGNVQTASTPTGLPSVDAVSKRNSIVPMYPGKSDRLRSERTVAAAASMLFPNAAPAPDRSAELMQDGPVQRSQPPPPYSVGTATQDQGLGQTLGLSIERRSASRQGSVSTAVSSTAGPPQIVRSMLDV